MKKVVFVLAGLILLGSLTACSFSEGSDGLSLYGGVVHNSDYTNQNNRYTFLHDMIPKDDDAYAIISMSEKTSIDGKVIPAFPTEKECYIHRLFATNNYLYVPRLIKASGTEVIDRINLKDFSVERVFEKTRIAEKIVFGLSFSFDQVEKDLGLHPDFVFSNDNDIFFSDYTKGIFKVMPDKTAKNIIADKIEHDVAYDGNYIFYVTVEGVLKQYEIKSSKTEILTDKTVTPYTLKVTKEDISFQSDGKKIVIKR
ncbi:MAG: hypothetical protein IJZ51_10110 [Ruminiclostridium sp.]|nr:hypothetical protein [Ruminiclostridium sp.]